MRETRKEGGRERDISHITVTQYLIFAYKYTITYLKTEDEQDCDILYCDDTDGERLGSGTEAGHGWVCLLGVDHETS